jgi:hypothetical protein
MPVDEDDPMFEGDDWSPDFHVLADDLREVEPVLEAQLASQQVTRWFLMEAIAQALCGDPNDPETTKRIAEWAKRPEHAPSIDLAVIVAGLACLVARQLPEEGALRLVDDLPQVRADAQQSIDNVVKAGLEIAELNDMIAAGADRGNRD